MRDMREILFRGKRVDNGEWAYGYVFDDGIVGSKRMFTGGLVITDSDGKSDSRYEVGADFHEVIPETRGEYTGLTDKNGVKICEGDIIKTGDSTVCSVEWDGENARFLGFTAGRERRIIYVGREPKAEVIGNIHDNPELLEGDDKK